MHFSVLVLTVAIFSTTYWLSGYLEASVIPPPPDNMRGITNDLEKLSFLKSFYFSILDSWTSVTTQRQTFNSLALASLSILNTAILPGIIGCNSTDWKVALALSILGLVVSLIWILVLKAYERIVWFKKQQAEKLHAYICTAHGVHEEVVTQFYKNQSKTLARCMTLTLLENALARLFYFEFVFITVELILKRLVSQ